MNQNSIKTHQINFLHVEITNRQGVEQFDTVQFFLRLSDGLLNMYRSRWPYDVKVTNLFSCVSKVSIITTVAEKKHVSLKL